MDTSQFYLQTRFASMWCVVRLRTISKRSTFQSVQLVPYTTLEVGGYWQPPAKVTTHFWVFTFCWHQGRACHFFLFWEMKWNVWAVVVELKVPTTRHPLSQNAVNLLSVLNLLFFCCFLLIYLFEVSCSCSSAFMTSSPEKYMYKYFFCFWGDRSATGIWFTRVSERHLAHTTVTCADWDVCLNHLITCGLHFDVAKKTQ